MLRACSNSPTASALRLSVAASPLASNIATRHIANIPEWERHIRFSPFEGRKRPCQDVLDRFKRLNNGMWIHGHPGWHTKRYQKDEKWQTTSLYWTTCTKEENWMLDKLMTPYWLRPKYYAHDPYEPYHVRHGLNTPRVYEKGPYRRERQKVLIDDTTSDMYIRDR